MNPVHVRNEIERILGRIAPEAEMDALDPSAPIRDQLDIDSFDFLRFIIAVHEALDVDVPESDYPRMFTLEGAVDYVMSARAKDQTAVQ